MYPPLTRTQKSPPDPNPEAPSLVTQGQSGRRHSFQAMAPAKLSSSITEGSRRAFCRKHHSDTGDAMSVRMRAHTPTSTHSFLWPWQRDLACECCFPFLRSAKSHSITNVTQARRCDYAAAPVIPPSAPRPQRTEAETATVGIEQSKARRSRAVYRDMVTTKPPLSLEKWLVFPELLLYLGLLPKRLPITRNGCKYLTQSLYQSMLRKITNDDSHLGSVSSLLISKQLCDKIWKDVIELISKYTALGNFLLRLMTGASPSLSCLFNRPVLGQCSTVIVQEGWRGSDRCRLQRKENGFLTNLADDLLLLFW